MKKWVLSGKQIPRITINISNIYPQPIHNLTFKFANTDILGGEHLRVEKQK